MKYTILVFLIILSACATDRPQEDNREESSGPTVFGQLSVSVDRATVE